MRAGIGYDVHQLVFGRRLVLGGVEIDYAKGARGHSDAATRQYCVRSWHVLCLIARPTGRFIVPDEPFILPAIEYSTGPRAVFVNPAAIILSQMDARTVLAVLEDVDLRVGRSRHKSMNSSSSAGSTSTR